ncbi:molecular chaperone TorD family protein [Cytobacillus spongiae]|uniref:molecular chaperone TorD family protein n=1 Tax=Cytobacillus spongiae TaxID=2901381 RepID=UPI001F17347D|nr:molecular chaperone TorD family protein [Cytobacillus spongiae]UII56816.1 molecular chaperone TorD family protein [Cytobacillus spongiae]
MTQLKQEQQGKMAIANILSSIWLGEWNQYEILMNQIPKELQDQLPFHTYYDREQVELWYENHFFIPGKFFISPYLSSYKVNEGEGTESRKKDLLCLIQLYESMGFYYPLENDRYPDHLGCITLFLSALVNEQLENEENYNVLVDIEREIVKKHIQPVLQMVVTEGSNKLHHPFLREFLFFYKETIEEDWDISA